MESESGNEGEISIGPFGGTVGKVFSYRAKHAIINKIVISHNHRNITSLLFKGYNESESDYDYPAIFGVIGHSEPEISIKFPSDFLTGVSGTWDQVLSPLTGQYVDAITSLKFYTKHSEYGPFGPQSGNHFSFRPKGSFITGFHGQTRGQFGLVSIGSYFKHVNFIPDLTPKDQTSESITIHLLPRNPGPWGSTEGRPFDDGIFAAVRRVHVHICHTKAISAIQFQYVKKDRSTIWSTMHGVPCVDFNVVEKDEYLVGIEGFYCSSMIRSLTFLTNKSKYGPVGCETGEFFTSYACNGKVVGVFGRTGAYLNAIGVHNDYF